MKQSATSRVLSLPCASPQAVRHIVRTETVLSRFPIHDLTKRGKVAIRIQRTDAQGDLYVRWHVSYNNHYGPPGPLAYKLDTLVINRLLDTLHRPLPSVLKLGSQRQISALLDVAISGRQMAHLQTAFHQNASAYIVAYLRYRDRDGRERTINTGFTRYRVIFTGECLPDGTTADAVYLVLSDIYRDILNHAPVRPLDYTYLKALTPTAQRFYEIVSYKIFPALKYRRPYATMRYSDYCLLSTQQRFMLYEQVKKQLYKVHRPHLESGYLAKVAYTTSTDADGQPDWLLHYTPGPKAHAEYTAFQRQPNAVTDVGLACPEDAEQVDLLAFITPDVPEITPLPRVVPVGRPPEVAPETEASATLAAGLEPAAQTAEPLPPQAVALVQQFYQRFYGLTGVTPSAKEVEQATDVLAMHGEAPAHFLLTYAYEAAMATSYQPQVFGGILHYLPRALSAYAARTARATHATTRQVEATERTQRERYAQWRQQQLAVLRAQLPETELAALEATAQARLLADGTAACALPLAVRLAVDDRLEAQAGLPDFAAWQQAHPPHDAGDQ